MDNGHQDIDEICGSEAALKVGSVSSVELDEVCPLFLSSWFQRGKYDHGGRRVTVKVE
jgi:hypothetical protein